MKNRSSLARGQGRRKTITALWTVALSIVTVLLVYWEMTALLYILATLGVTALLIIVALSDLTGSEKAFVPGDDLLPNVNDSGLASTDRSPQRSK